MDIPSLHISDAIFPLSITCQILPWLSGVFATQVDLQHAKDAQSLVAETRNCVGDLFWRRTSEVVDLALVWSARAMPEAWYGKHCVSEVCRSVPMLYGCG